MCTIAVAVNTGLTNARKGKTMKLEPRNSTLGLYAKVEVNYVG